MNYDGFIFISLSGKGGLPVILKAIMENDVEDNFLQYLLGVGDVSDFIQRKENLPQLPTTSGLFQTCPDTKSTVLGHFYMLYIYIYLDGIISELEKRLQGSNLHDLDKMDCKQTCKAAHVILHNTFSKNQLRDHKLYAQPLMHPFTNYLLHR